MVEPVRHETAGEIPGADALDREAAETLARTLRVIADPTRLQILSYIHATSDGECVVGELADFLRLRQPTVSHHLRVMVDDGLLRRRQDGRNVWYAILEERLPAISDLLS